MAALSSPIGQNQPDQHGARHRAGQEELRQHLSQAQRALHGLERATAGLRAHLGDDLDANRLEEDVRRLAASIALLRRQVPDTERPEPATGPPRQVIPDGEYDPAFFADADDEGLGAQSRYRT